MTRYYHTSPVAIERIHRTGLFGEFLFFASKPYFMGQASTCLVYAVDVDDEEIIEARRLFYHPEASRLDSLVAEFCARYGVPADLAEDIISEHAQLEDCDAEASWACQHFTARAAKLLGYRGVHVTDEQGSAVMLDMLDHEADLILLDPQTELSHE